QVQSMGKTLRRGARGSSGGRGALAGAEGGGRGAEASRAGSSGPGAASGGRGAGRGGGRGRGFPEKGGDARAAGGSAPPLLAPPLSPLAARPVSALRPPPSALQEAPERLDRGRFTVVYFPPDAVLARSLVERALATDTFPGLPRPQQHVLIAVAPDERRFR